MFIQNAVYKAIPTDGLTFPLAEGTVITVGDVTGIVPENIALAAPTGLIYLATGGTIDLTSEANAGVTFTDEQLKELGGDFNFIPLAESGGSSLPSYSSADIGKVFAVGKEMKTVVVVPEQTVTTDENGNATITGVDFSELSNGQTVAVYSNGTPTNATYDAEAGGLTYRGNVIVSQSTITNGPNRTITVKALSDVPATSMSYVVPEQTVTIAEGASSALLSNSDSVSILTNGADAVLNVNGTVYNTTVFNDWRGIGVSVSINSTDEYAITTNGVVTVFRAVRHVDDGDGMSHEERIPGNYTVSLFAPVPSVEPKWEAAGLPDYSDAAEGAVLIIVGGVPTWTTT